MKEYFTLDGEGRREVERALRSLMEVCQTHRLPMFATVTVENTEAGTEYARIVYGAASHGVRLTDDQIRHHILIADGFHAVPEREDMVVNTADFFQ